MAPLTRIWTIITQVISSFTFTSFSPFAEYGPDQHPIENVHDAHGNELTTRPKRPKYPVFRPPGSNIDGFQCEYPSMPDWSQSCQSDTKTCWLVNKDSKERYDINTDYESDAPVGIDRTYTLVLDDGWINADGMNFTLGKLFNNSFPGPLIEACWGDRVHIKVYNQLAMNGTSVHMHGIRQNQTMHMDGVNGVTQCPIAPGDYFEYVFNATQYGSSWYHSHYSVQYADGAHAPITIHGPTSAEYDNSIEPLIMTDWSHNSAFQIQYPPFQALYPSILLNGRGNITRFNGVEAPLEIPDAYEIYFNAIPPNSKTGARRYLLRLINSAYNSGFVFSIDNHLLQVVETDFVPISPYTTDSVLVAIGQRYHVIVEAKPQSAIVDGKPVNPIPGDGNFWIRTWVADNCTTGGQGIDGYERTGILRYIQASNSDPVSVQWPDISLECVDEQYSDLKPIVPWTVGKPANGVIGEEFDVTSVVGEGQFATAFFSFERPNYIDVNPMQTTYGNPTFLNLDNTAGIWPVGWVIVPENYTSTSWVYLILNVDTNSGANNSSPHPMHLHGHDFAILQQSYVPFTPDLLRNNKYDNPPRRDVVLLPNNGFVVIAFQSDNPGTWLLHCHIAGHASSGLAMQILERQAEANVIWPPGNSRALTEAQRVCGNWNSWAYDCRNYWPGNVNSSEYPVYPSCVDATMLQNDSGI